MAKGLKVGDMVTVRKELRLQRKLEAYKAGLKRLKPGTVGKIVQKANGRSVVVEFEGKQVQLSSQRLDLVPAKAETQSAQTPRKRGRKKALAPASSPARTTPVPDTAKLVDYSSPHFITSVANKLLSTASLEPDPETVVVQIRLSDLPLAVRDQVQALMRAKLELGPQVSTADNLPRRRGRPKTK